MGGSRFKRKSIGPPTGGLGCHWWGGVIFLPVTRIHHNNTQMTDGAALPDDRAMWQTGDSESPPPLQMDQMGVCCQGGPGLAPESRRVGILQSTV